MTLYLLKVHLQTFISIPVTQKCEILSCDNLGASERYFFELKGNTHAVKAYTGTRAAVPFIFNPQILIRGEWSASRPSRFIFGFQLIGEWEGPKGQCEYFQF
jgi:hypothetical protein